MAWFKLDNAYIVSELCENRFEELSDCHGHCVLEKTVNDAQPIQAISLEFKQLEGVFGNSGNKLFLPSKACHFGALTFHVFEDFIPGIFQPPEQVI